jgi:hypothetical protein
MASQLTSLVSQQLYHSSRHDSLYTKKMEDRNLSPSHSEEDDLWNLHSCAYNTNPPLLRSSPSSYLKLRSSLVLLSTQRTPLSKEPEISKYSSKKMGSQWEFIEHDKRILLQMSTFWTISLSTIRDKV